MAISEWVTGVLLIVVLNVPVLVEPAAYIHWLFYNGDIWRFLPFTPHEEELAAVETYKVSFRRGSGGEIGGSKVLEILPGNQQKTSLKYW